MLNAIGDSLSDPACSHDEEEGEDEDDEGDTEPGKLIYDDKPGWVMGTISKTVPHRMERFRQKQMKLEKLPRLGWEDAANYFREREMMYGTAELNILSGVKPQTYLPGPTTSLTTCGGHMQTLGVIPGPASML